MEKEATAEIVTFVVLPYQHLDAVCPPCVLSLVIIPLRTYPHHHLQFCTSIPTLSRNLRASSAGKMKVVNSRGLSASQPPACELNLQPQP